MIKEYIINNFKTDNYKEIKTSIEEAISSNEETMLPGLGVLFEILWQISDNELKNIIITNIKKGIQKGPVIN